MPGRYFSAKDRGLFEHFSKEIVGDLIRSKDGIINTVCEIYKISVYDTETNIYGESKGGKQYNPGVQLACLIAHDDFNWNTDNFGPDLNQNATFAFLRETLIEADIRPLLGDIIAWNYSYFEISSINENKLIGGQQSSNWDVVCTGFLTRITNTNIERSHSV